MVWQARQGKLRSGALRRGNVWCGVVRFGRQGRAWCVAVRMGTFWRGLAGTVSLGTSS